MSSSKLSITVPGLPEIPFPTSRRAKIVIVSVGVGVIILGVAARCLQRRRKRTWHDIRARQAARKKCLTNLKSPTDARYCRRSNSPANQQCRANSICSVGGYSTSSTHENVQLHFCRQGLEALGIAIQNWEDALSAGMPPNLETGVLALPSAAESKLTHHLEQLIEKAIDIQDEYEQLFLGKSTEAEDDLSVILEQKDIPEGVREVIGESESSSEAEDFLSATEELSDLNDLLADLRDVSPLYQMGLKEVKMGGVPYRTLRTTMLNCSSHTDFLSKLYGVRLAFEQIVMEETLRTWFIDTGRELLSNLLIEAEKEPKDFTDAFNNMINYLKSMEDWSDIEEELSGRDVQMLSFFDVALDFILLDAFEDLENPPSSVTAIMQNRWLSNGFKETALITAVWSVLKAKRRRLRYPSGFISHFYDISQYTSPVLAWGFLGPESKLKLLCENFKEQTLGFVQDIFNLNKCRFTSVEELADDIMFCARSRSQQAFEKMSAVV